MADRVPIQDLSLNREVSRQRLVKHLQDDLKMPPETWWADVKRTFSQLCEMLRLRIDGNALGEEHGDADDEYAANARLAREAALPIVIVVPSGTHVLRLSAIDEHLECIAFGTVTPKLYLEVFWESVVRTQQSKDVTLVVHKVDEGSIPRILISFEGHTFSLRYYHCDMLVRSYPKILDAAAPFLKDRKHCSKVVEETVERLQNEWKICDHYDQYPDHRVAYYFLRGWAVIRGLFGIRHGALAAQDIVRLCERPSCTPILPYEVCKCTFPSLVNEFYRSDRSISYFESPTEAETFSYKPTRLCWDADWIRTIHEELRRMTSEIDSLLDHTQALEHNSQNWDELLARLVAEPFHEKMVFPYYVRINVMYTGYSNTKGGEWLSMVESKLGLLKDSLQASIRNEHYIRIWPQRLVSFNADPDDDIYEGCYILGLQPKYKQADIPIAVEVAERWKLQRRADELTVADQCFIDVVICEGDSDIRKERLKSCTREWPLPILTAEESQSWHGGVWEQLNHLPTSGDSSGKGPNKRGKNHNDRSWKEQDDNENRREKDGDFHDSGESPSSSESKPLRLRPAADVLNRLRYDRDYNIDEIVIGYKDRHDTTRMLEKPAAEWTRETTDQEFIPEHRIEYFKRQKASGTIEMLWNKSMRLDMIFANSGRKAL